MIVALVVVAGHVVAALLLAWGYFRRYTVARPPVGVFNLWDVAVMMGGILLVPYLYFLLPIWLVAGLLALGVLNVLYVALEPVLRARAAVWAATLALVAGAAGAARWAGAMGAPYFAANNIVLVAAIIGITNLWAQSGMRARDAALLGGALAVYDVIVTWQLGQSADLFGRLFGLPFAPILAWPAGAGSLWLGLGMGDMLLAAVFPLVMRKAFGRDAGAASLVGSLGLIVVLLAVVASGQLRALFPVMVALGPLMLLQYAYWRRRRGPERTMWQYRHAALR
jgi:hypothetical protein